MVCELGFVPEIATQFYVELKRVKSISNLMLKTIRTGEIMKKTGIKFDITKQELRVLEENFYFDTERDAFIALYEYSFNPDEYFGALNYKSNVAANLCFLTEWSIETDEISMYYYGDFIECDNGELEKILTQKEKEFFKT